VPPIYSSFFSRWFDTKSVEVKQQVRKFVENGQLEFVEGAVVFFFVFSDHHVAFILSWQPLTV
jgi:hypothetical protein